MKVVCAESAGKRATSSASDAAVRHCTSSVQMIPAARIGCSSRRLVPGVDESRQYASRRKAQCDHLSRSAAQVRSKLA